MEEKTPTLAPPDLSERPFQCTVERDAPLSPEALYRAWTDQFGLWFTSPESIAVTPIVGAPFFMEARHGDLRHPHYGRFLRLEPNRLVEMTWVTTATLGAETVVTVEFASQGAQTHVRLTHAGFPDEETMGHHRDSWPFVLEHMEKKLSAV